MLQVTIDASCAQTDTRFGVLDVEFPPAISWDEDAFRALEERELEKVKKQGEAYERKSAFGEDPYFRYFRRFKKTYPVTLQLESILRADRPFPNVNPINEVAFLAELTTRTLLGTHDVDRIDGALDLYRAAEKTPFRGVGGHNVHTYPGDLTGRDASGIIFGMIGGADDRTCVHEQTSHAAYFAFGVPGEDRSRIETALAVVASYATTLAADARVESLVL